MPAINSRFRTAIHSLAVIAYVPEKQASSDTIAASVATDASVVRRLLSSLRTAGLVLTVEGRSGGYALARPAERITLQDIHDAVATDNLFAMPERLPNADCPVGAHIHGVLDQPLAAAKAAMAVELSRISLADVMSAIEAA